ncbi:MAG: ABC transporter ATP-binding protein, partial [Myxococcales bacterium]|nr:ABC transporter ATP-binding protein [Myxococcales bacterium]
LVGANGSGKTTLLRIIAGELMIDTGTLEFPMIEPDGQWLDIKSHISYVPQDTTRWYGPLQDTLRYEAALQGMRGSDNDDEIEFMLERLGLTSFKDATWSQISGGYKTRFALARALIRRPKLLVLDEPLAALDVIAQTHYLRDLRDIASNSHNPPAVILSSQHLHEVESIADRLLVLDRGTLRFDGVAAQLHEQLRSNCFDFGFRGEPRVVEAAIAQLGQNVDLQRVGNNYTLTVPPHVSLEHVIMLFGEAAIEVSYIRNISASTRRLFVHEKS